MFLKGFLLGLSIAAPVGPIGILCIRRTLANGRLSGFLSGLGAAAADAVYGSLAAFGLTMVSAFLVEQQVLIRLVGGIFLLYLGIRTIRAQPKILGGQETARSAFSDVATTFFLTLTNPMTIISFAAVFAGLGLVSAAGNVGQAVQLVLGVFLGSAAWWLILSFGISLLRVEMTPPRLRWINWISGAILIGFSIVALWSMIGLLTPS